MLKLRSNFSTICAPSPKSLKLASVRVEAPEPFFAKFKPSGEDTREYEGKLLAKVFLPFSDLHFLNQKRWGEMRRSFEARQQILDTDVDIDWMEQDEEGNPMPGNITGEIYWAVQLSLPLTRLHQIRQLSLLAPATEGERAIFFAAASEFPQSRSLHSLLTAKIAELISTNNHLSQDQTNLAILAGLLHDLATPAGGDPIKEIDPEALSEEKALPRLLTAYDLSQLAQYGFDLEKILSIINGKGTLGQILDIADKISYTAVDSYFLGASPTRVFNEPEMDSLMTPIRSIIRQDPFWANVYQEVSITDQGQVYIKDHERLGRFLAIRALMHRILYRNPHCRGRDLMFKMLTTPLYSREPHPDFPLNAQNLIFYTDEELGRIINRHWRIIDQDIPFQAVLGVLPDCKFVRDKKEIPDADAELERRSTLIIGAETINSFNPCVEFATVDPKDGKIKPYREVNPTIAGFLQEVADACQQTVIHYWPEDKATDRTWGTTLKPVIAKIVEKERQAHGGQIPHYQFT